MQTGRANKISDRSSKVRPIGIWEDKSVDLKYQNWCKEATDAPNFHGIKKGDKVAQEPKKREEKTEEIEKSLDQEGNIIESPEDVEDEDDEDDEDDEEEETIEGVEPEE